MSKFDNVSCSQCGQEFGPGNHGFSHCEHHRSKPGASAPQEFGSTIDRTLPAGILPQQADAPPEQHPLRCDDGGQCGVGGYCDDCPARSERAEQQGDGGARIKHIQSLMLKWINTRPGNPAEAVWHEIERELKATIVQPSARVALSERTRAYLSDHAELFRLNGDAVLADELAAILAASSAQTGESKP